MLTLTLSFQLDPTLRHTFWTLLIGGSWYWIICNTNQNVIQRFLALKDQKTARKGSIIYVIGITILISMCIYNGLLLYATYHDCDPLTTKLAKAKDQLVPLLVMQILQDIPGLPGLFIAGVFSGKYSQLRHFLLLTISLNNVNNFSCSCTELALIWTQFHVGFGA